MSIYSKMAEAARIVGYGVSKDGKNQAQRYDFTSAANVRKHCGPALGRVGIAVGSKIEVLCSEQRTTSKGSVMNHMEVIVTLTFYDGETGESLSAQGIGCGTDTVDKAPMKAQTAAEKYAYVSAFTLAMGEDPEADEATDREREAARPGPPPNPAVAELRAHFRDLRQVENSEDLHAWTRDAAPLLVKVDAATRDTAVSRIIEVGAPMGVEASHVLSWIGRYAEEAAQ